MSLNSQSRRSLDLDVLRGLAVCMMITFHFCFDLQHFKLFFFDIYNAYEWRVFRYVIISLFLFCVGISLHMVHSKGIRWERFLKRAGLLLVASVGISVLTYYIFPKTWIYFGILHFIFTASFLGLLFIRIPWISLFCGLAIVVAYHTDQIGYRWMFDWLGDLIPRRSEDKVPLVPWFGAVLIGIFAGRYKLYIFNCPDLPVTRTIGYLGKNAFWVYLIHQPILFGGVFLYARFLA